MSATPPRRAGGTLAPPSRSATAREGSAAAGAGKASDARRAGVAGGLLERFPMRGPGLLLALAAALLARGCLVTDSLLEQPDAGPAVNHPVVIVEDSVAPNNWTPVQLNRDSTPACQQTFKVNVVSDEDVGDDLVARWFVDCGEPPDQIAREEDGGTSGWNGCLPLFSPLERTGKPERAGPSFVFTSAVPGLHMIKLMVSDGFSVGAPGVVKGRSVAAYEWVVQVAGECQGVTP